MLVTSNCYFCRLNAYLMRFIILFIWVIALQHTAQCQKMSTLGVAFYNLENFYDTINDPNKDDDEFTPNGANNYTPKVFLEKVNNLADVISVIGTDKAENGFALIGVAEVENQDVLEVLCDHPKLRKRNLKPIIFEGPDQRSIDCGLIYNPDYFKLLQASSLTVPVDPGDRPTRDVLYVVGKLRGEIVHVFVNHWPSRRGGESATRPKRKAAAAVSRHIIDSLMMIDPLTKVIVMGDLNDDPINESITKVLGAKAKQKDVKPGELFNPFTAFYKKGIGSSAYQDAWGLFDQIIISYGFLQGKGKPVQFKEAEIFHRGFMVEKYGQYKNYPKRSFSNGLWNNGYSDHYPAVVYFSY
jgi:hypothetical protein